MNLTPSQLINTLTVIFAAFVAYFVIPLNYFPYFGVSMSLLGFAAFTYSHKKDIDSDTIKYLVLSSVFAILILIRSEPLITFLNLVASLFFGTLYLTSGTKAPLGFVETLASPIILFIKSFFTKSVYPTRSLKPTKKTNYTNTAIGIAVSIPLLAVVLPLLASANPIFKRYLEDIHAVLNLSNIFLRLGEDTIIIWCARFVVFMTILYFVPKVLTLIEKRNDFNIPINLPSYSFPLDIPKFTMCVVLIVFFAAQLQLYFATPEYLESLNITHSQRAREVFGQLTVVAGILMLLIYNDRSNTRKNVLLNRILGVEGAFLTLMAFKSAFDYIGAWGLTYLRLYGIAFAAWVMGIFAIYFAGLKKNDFVPNFVKTVIYYSGLLLIIINLVNFDYMIYHSKKAATGQGTDYNYLTTLSADSMSFKDHYEHITAVGYKPVIGQENPIRLIYKIESLQNKYKKFDIRTFNLMDYMEYRKIKDIDTTGFDRNSDQIHSF